MKARLSLSDINFVVCEEIASLHTLITRHGAVKRNCNMRFMRQVYYISMHNTVLPAL
jgi:hypothetical protein